MKPPKALIVFALLLAVFCTGLLSFKAVTNQQLQRRLELGDSYLQAGYYAPAILYYQKAVDIDPQNAQALFGLAAAYISSEDYQNAEAAINAANATGSLTAQLYEDLIRVCIIQGKFGIAEKLLEAAKLEFTDDASLKRVEIELRDPKLRLGAPDGTSAAMAEASPLAPVIEEDEVQDYTDEDVNADDDLGPAVVAETPASESAPVPDTGVVQYYSVDQASPAMEIEPPDQAIEDSNPEPDLVPSGEESNPGPDSSPPNGHTDGPTIPAVESEQPDEESSQSVEPGLFEGEDEGEVNSVVES